ncbi:MAG: hypothetical protein QXL01_07625 [Thermoplasmatales archaeon]
MGGYGAAGSGQFKPCVCACYERHIREYLDKVFGRRRLSPRSTYMAYQEILAALRYGDREAIVSSFANFDIDGDLLLLSPVQVIRSFLASNKLPEASHLLAALLIDYPSRFIVGNDRGGASLDDIDLLQPFLFVNVGEERAPCLPFLHRHPEGLALYFAISAYLSTIYLSLVPRLFKAIQDASESVRRTETKTLGASLGLASWIGWLSVAEEVLS